MGTSPSSFGPTIGCTCRTFIRWPPDSTKPPVPTAKLSAKGSTPASTAFALTSITRSSGTPFAASLAGST